MTESVCAPDFEYAGTEFSVFAKATRWKAYWGSRIAAYVRGNVLEVGAGIGANTTALAAHNYRSWICLEPDAALARRIALPAGGRHRTVTGVIGSLAPEERFDTILYID
ncbi:MAG: class I SAM-dependent methyltransferase, partial [Pseudomonadota bacterium]